MKYIIFFGYLFLFSWLVTRIRFFTNTGLPKSQLLILFLLKVAAGFLYGWMGWHYGGTAQMVDTWSYHFDGLAEYHLLGSSPHEYFTNLFHNPYPGGFLNFFGSSDSYWNDLKSNIFIKLLSVFDIFSFGHYYVNVIFYSFLTFFGPIALYKIMKDAFPGRNYLLLAVIFLIPSFLYWSSGIHKEGLIFTAIALIVYNIYFATQEKGIRTVRWLGILTGVLTLLFLRNFVLVIIIPAIIAWMLTLKFPRHRLACFSLVYLFFGILFFTMRYVNARFDFPQAVVDKQQAFMQIKGGTSSLPIKQLEPTALSFLLNTPQAITLSMVRPYPDDIAHFFLLSAAVETYLVLLLFIIFILFSQRQKESHNVILYFSLFFSFSVLLAIGLSVNNLGAIVRYRSIILPFLVATFVGRIDWKRLFRKYS